MSDAYRQWIAKTRFKPDYVNNFFTATLFHNMEHNHAMHKSYPIPLFLLEEELKREDQNTQLQPDRATVSLAIKFMMIDLLRNCRPQEPVTEVSYEAVLREVLDREGLLPSGMPNPIDPTTSFHCLPTLCKTYIIGSLRKYCNLPFVYPKAVATDSNGNDFYVLPDGRVYAYVKTTTDSPATQAVNDNKSWSPLLTYVQQYQLNLLSTSANEWAEVETFLLTHGQQRLYSALSGVVKNALKYGEVRMSERQRDRADFDYFLTPIVAQTPTPAQRSSRTFTNSSMAVMSLVDRKEKKCAFFPQCKRDNCKDVHPIDYCIEFNAHRPCPGLACLFMHGPCPIDGHCDDENCIHEHYESFPVALRKKRDFRQSRQGGAKKNIRCQHFPNCRTSAEKCKFVHPTTMCRKHIESVCVQGKLCVYLHGNCPDDGDCEDYECEYEHYESPPVAQRAKAHRRSVSRSFDTRQRSRSRAISERSRRESSPEYASSRRSYLSNSNDYSDDDDDEPVGDKAVEQRCRFFPGCKNEKRGCPYVHPKDPCKVFPNCPYGLACLFLHRECPKDGVCVKEGCNHEHYLRRNIGKRWCMNGSLCKKKSCAFIHPKECRAPCSSPGSCWMYHPATPTVPAEAKPPKRPAARSKSRSATSAARNRRSPSAPRNSARGQKTTNNRR